MTTATTTPATLATTNAPQLRSAAPPDLAAVERLLTASSLPLEGVREALSTFVVAESGGDIVGVAGLEVCCDNALLRSVAVQPEWRSHGLGRALVTRVLSDATNTIRFFGINGSQRPVLFVRSLVPERGAYRVGVGADGRLFIDPAPVADDGPAQKQIIFDPIPRVEGIDPSEDPLLELRAAIYLLSGRRRRAAG